MMMSLCERCKKWVRIKSILFCFAFTVAVSAHAAAHKKYLIEFGWDEPDSHYLREHITEMEKLPFDGCVFHINYQKPSGGEGSFTWEGWSSNTISKAQVASAIDDLKTTRFHRFTRNFLRFNVTPGDLDWFEDHSAILNNARLAAQIAREGKCQGVLFDIEQYNSPIFQYHSRRDATNKSWEVYARQVRQRGNEVMRAFREGWPEATIFLTFGYSLPWSNSRAGHKSLLDCNYGLLAPFLDGMMEVAAKGQIIDGAETAYSFNSPARFAPHYKTLREDLLPIVADPGTYQDKISIGFGIWLDHDWRKSGWDTNDVTKNYFTPALFEASVREALRVADDYVWIYTEQPRWWAKDGQPEKLPDAYVQALHRIHAVEKPPTDTNTR
jgi:hypothetical protein